MTIQKQENREERCQIYLRTIDLTVELLDIEDDLSIVKLLIGVLLFATWQTTG